MSFSLKSLCIQADFPFIYQFQQTIYHMLIARNSDYNISIGKGEYFFIKNFLINLIDYSFVEAIRNSKIQNVIICVRLFFY